MKKNHFLLILFVSFFFSSCAVLTLDQKKIDNLTVKFDNNTLSKEEKKYIKNIYKDFISGGSLLYPEASKILKYYISDHTGDFTIKSKYFFKSKFIKSILKKTGKEIIGPVKLSFKDDKRIAYAINGFYINTKKRIIYQYIDFAKRNDRITYTYFNLPKGIIKIPDRLIRVFEEDSGCRGFMINITE